MKVYVVGIGPGGLGEMTSRARAAIEASDVVAGYTLYMDMISAITPGKELVATPMKSERERCRAAIEAALAGKIAAVVSGGDAGVYGMAGLVCQMAEDYPELSVEIIPGVTSACAASAALGAPLGHDFAVISLSDLLTPWEQIQKRLQAAADADFIICIYNPSSKLRKDYLKYACEIVLRYRSGTTPCGIARNVGRKGESLATVTLDELKDMAADMFTTVIIGSSKTKIIGGKLVTPRGYAL